MSFELLMIERRGDMTRCVDVEDIAAGAPLTDVIQKEDSSTTLVRKAGAV